MNMQNIVNAFENMAQVDVKNAPNYRVMKRIIDNPEGKNVPNAARIGATVTIDVSQQIIEQYEEELNQCIDHFSTLLEKMYNALREDYGSAAVEMIVDMAQEFKFELN